MIWHPLSLSVLTLDLLALLLMIAALPAVLDVAAAWTPSASDAAQIRRELGAETAALNVRWALVFFLVATLVWIAAVSGVLVELVPGAMCGTGVMQAMAARGPRALALRMLAVWVGYQWRVLERLNRRLSDAALAPLVARVSCVVLPVALLAVADTYQALAHLNAQAPVSCCSVVYDQFRSLAEAHEWAGVSDRSLVGGTLALGLALLAAAAAVWRGPQRVGRAAVLAVLGPVWSAVAALTLVRVLSAYYYGVLHHHCPWCLFLPEHHRIGYLLFGLLAAATLEAPAALTAARCGDRVPAANERARR
ncbi:MAG: hypothetical protein V2L15_03935, partial [Desulfobacteraceae bacterium]|nr:hypothetical protein [Desulfobacteraceae bacterium]